MDLISIQFQLMELISKTYAKQRNKLINPTQAAKSYLAGKLEDGDTIYLTVADNEGNMVSLIQSNYRGMGSGMVPPQLGFMLQDRGEMFSLDPNHAISGGASDHFILSFLHLLPKMINLYQFWFNGRDATSRSCTNCNKFN